MGLFRRRSRTERSKQAGRGEPGDYQKVVDDAGEAVGLWFADAKHARDPMLVSALLLKEDMGHLLRSERRLASNTVDDRGGLFLMFDGRPAPGEPEAPASSSRSASTVPDAADSLTFNGQTYPVHDDFDAFSRDAAAGRTALLRTTISGLSMDDKSRLFRVMADAFGNNSAQARAVSESGFYCTTCFQGYTAAVLLLREILNKGGSSNARDITECRRCGGQDAVWVYRPPGVK
jgi:hypothetical protein